MESAQEVKNGILDVFAEKYGSKDGVRVFFAPGRVNLIGEHTDYNGGHVFPCALTIGTYGAVRMRDDRQLRFYSMNFEDKGVITSSLDELKPLEDKDWIAYPKGMIWAFGEKGYKVDKGFDLVLYGNIPNGSGLSSSASVEVLTGYFLREMYGFDGISNQDIALIGQYSENKYNGVNCGIMDQFAIAMGKKDNAIFLDTATLQYEYAPVDLHDSKLVIVCSNKKRGLGDSKYNERRAECEKALSEIREFLDVKTLGDLDEATFGKFESLIKDEVRVRRARHAVYENRRTVSAVEALRRGVIKVFGQLMNASHESLRDDYEVTGIELDTLVDAARKVPGVIGARMTGAGFGGCTVNIVKESSVDEFIKTVGEEYLNKIGYAADFYVVDIGDGPAEI